MPFLKREIFISKWTLSSKVNFEGVLYLHRKTPFNERQLLIKQHSKWKLSFNEGHFLMEDNLRWKNTSYERGPKIKKMPQSGLSSMQGSSSTKICLPLKVVFHQKLSSTKGRRPPKVVFHQRTSSTYHNTWVHLIFVKAVNIPNLRFLPAEHDAWCMIHDAWCIMHDA